MLVCSEDRTHHSCAPGYMLGSTSSWSDGAARRLGSMGQAWTGKAWGRALHTVTIITGVHLTPPHLAPADSLS